MPYTRPIQDTLFCFAKICDNKNELPTFNGKELKGFFEKIKKDYSGIFEDVTENRINDELTPLKMSKLIKWIAPDEHPFLLDKAALLYYNKFKEKYNPDIMDVAKKFYNQLGCNLEGIPGKHTKIVKD